MSSLTQEMRQHLRNALNAARGRARKRGESFDLTIDFLVSLWERQEGRCALSGLAFHDEPFDKAHVKRPFAPSIDRIEPSLPYTQDNVQLVCTAVNFARGQWGDDVLRQIAHGVVETERKDQDAWYQEKTAELEQAKQVLETLVGAQRERQKRHIAGLKAARTKGPTRLRGAARRATKQRKN